MDKPVCELHSPQEQTQLISTSFMIKETAIKKQQKGNKRFIWKEPSGDIRSHCAFYKERTISECRA